VGAAGAGLTLVLLRPARAEWPTRPNLVLISIDTLRADRLGCYGYDLATSPNLDAFAERSMRFERAYTTDAWTLTAHASMLTGLGPLAHGVDREVALSTQVPTLAERLADAGYTTLGVVDSCVWLDQRYGLGRGFDAYRVVKGDARVKAREAQYLLDRAGDAPFFLFFHVYDVHSDWEHLPYEADPEDHAALAGWYEGEFQACDDEGRCASEYLQALNSRGEVLEGADRRYLASLYDAGVRSLDRRLGELFAALEERGVFENSVVILTSDHGEEFFEHGKCLHSTHHEVCVRVPLLVRTPDTQGEVSRSLSSSVDLAPTLLDYAGLALGEVQGRSLRPALSGDVEAEGHAYVSTARGGVVYSVRDHEWALVLDESGWVVVGPQGPMPLEQAPPEVGARLLAWVERERRLGLELAARFGGGDISAPLTESEQRSLRALGYGGGD